MNLGPDINATEFSNLLVSGLGYAYAMPSSSAGIFVFSIPQVSCKISGSSLTIKQTDRTDI